MRAIRKSWIWVLLVGISLAFNSAAYADALADYEHARNDYDAGRFAQAADRFHSIIDPDKGSALNDPVLLEQSRVYYASCLVALGKTTEADKAIREILLVNPSARPDPVVFPRVVVDRFTDVRPRIRAELDSMAAADAKKKQESEAKQRRAREAEKARIKELEKLARQELNVTHNSRWIAAIPFGVGQFQNGQTAGGVLFLATELALAAGSITTAVIVQSYESHGNDPGVDTAALNSRVRTFRDANYLTFGGMMAVAAGGVLHAQLTFVPEFRVTRERRIPPPLVVGRRSVVPSVGMLPGGGFFGLQGTF